MCVTWIHLPASDVRFTAATPAERMRPRITLITLGVAVLERAVAFYRDGLGLPTKGIVGAEHENGAVAFFEMESGLKLALWPRRSLAADAGLPIAHSNPADFSLAHNVGSRGEVDEVMAQAVRAGAKVVKPAQETSWGGYAGCFQDPDGHLWEIAFNPGTTIPLPIVDFSEEQRGLWKCVTDLWEISRQKDEGRIRSALHPDYVGWDMTAALPHDRDAAVLSVSGDSSELRDY